QATATEIGVTGVRRPPWANAPFIPGDLADYMEAQFIFLNSAKISDSGRPVMAGLNYFLTHENRGSSESGLLGEKRDVKVWLGWLDRFANGEVEAVDSPIGWLPRYADLKELFDDIGKPYPKSLYDMQFALYIDNIVNRIDLQTEAYRKEENIPTQLFTIYEKQKADLLALKEKHGSVVSIDDLG
ncbi:MAG: phosphoenolpyruvate carboxykinase domain-containing protein, partial [Desulfofustis sp.]